MHSRGVCWSKNSEASESKVKRAMKRSSVGWKGLVSLLYDIRYFALTCLMAGAGSFAKRLEAIHMMFDAVTYASSFDVKCLAVI